MIQKTVPYILISLLSFALFADVSPKPPRHLTPENELIGGCIDPLNGVYFDDEVDLEVPESANLCIRRLYSSVENAEEDPEENFNCRRRSTKIHHFFSRWRWNHATEGYWSNAQSNIHVATTDGGYKVFDLSPDQKSASLKSETFKYWNNYNGGIISARTDHHNTKLLDIHPASTKSIAKWKLKECTGVERIYEGPTAQFNHDDRYHRQIRAESVRRFPSGLSWIYDHESPLWVNSVKAHDRAGKELSFLSFGQIEPNCYEIRSSTGDFVRYHLEGETSWSWPNLHNQKHNFKTIKSVESSQKPTITYEYGSRWSGRDLGDELSFITKKSYPKVEGKDRYSRIQYYHLPKCDLDLSMVECGYYSASYRDAGRVIAYSAPDSTGKEVTLYRFMYFDDGSEVIDACEFKRRYYKEQRATQGRLVEALSRVDYFDEYNKLQMRRQFRWIPKNHDLEAWLRSYWLDDNKGNTLVLKNYEYDDVGNIIKETTWTRLNRNCSFPKSRDGYIANESQTSGYETKYEYTKEPFHLKTKEKHPSGRVDEYTYEPSTDCVKTHLVRWNGKITSRQYFEYDNFGKPCLMIEDDGCSCDFESLEGVYKRIIVRTKRFSEGSLAGLVKEQVHSYYDKNLDCEFDLSRIDFTYNAKRMPTSKTVTDLVTSQSATTHYQFDDHQNLILEITPRGARIQRWFDANDNLVMQTGPRENTVLRYSYAPTCQPLQMTLETPVGNFTTHFIYNAMGQCIEEIGPYGQSEKRTYDFLAREIKSERSGILGEDLKPLNKSYVATSAYDVLGNKIEEVDELGYKTCYEYNGLGQLLFQQNPDGSYIEFYYDNKGFLVSKNFSEGYSEEYKYDSVGRVSRRIRASKEGQVTTRYFYEGNFLVKEIDSLGNTDSYTYDAVGRKISHKRIDAQTGQMFYEEWEYTGLGKVSLHRKWQDKENYIEEVTFYDCEGEVQETFHRNHLGQVQGHLLFIRNMYGDVIEKRHLHGDHQSSEFFEYNELGELSSYTDQLGFTIQYNRKYLTERFGVLGNEIEELRPSGDRKWSFEDGRHLTLELKLYTSEGTLNSHKYLGYDIFGRLTFRLEEVLEKGETVAEPIVTSVRFGPNNQVLERWDAKGSEKERHRCWQYNKIGQCERKIEPSGLTHEYLYDTCGRLTQSWSSDQSINYAYEYDCFDRTIKITNLLTGKATERHYDAWNRVISETLENGYTYQRFYNGLDKPIKEVYEDGSSLERQYVGAHLSSVIRRNPNLEAYEHGILTYDSQGRPTEEKMPGSLGAIVRRYDDKGHVIYLERPYYKAHEIIYDMRERLVSRIVEDSLNKTEEDYNYDALDQLITESALEKHIYGHDSRMRRTSKDEQKLLNDSLDQLVDIESGEDCEFSYDEDGRLISFKHQKELWNLRYDAWSRLIEVATPTFSIIYDYDESDRRLSKTVTSCFETLHEEYGYIDRRLVTIFKGSETLHRFFIHAEGSEQGDTLSLEIASDGATQLYFPVLDLAGSTVGWMTKDGALLQAWRYDAFGVIQREPENLLAPFGFSSKQTDPETGFVHYGRRYYVPTWGRWLSRDPKGEIDGSNLYAFVGNNPLTKFDSWGLFGLDSGWVDRMVDNDIFADAYCGSPDMLASLSIGEISSIEVSVGVVNFEKVANGGIKLIYNGSDKKSDAPYELMMPGSNCGFEDALMQAYEASLLSKQDVYGVVFRSQGSILDLFAALAERVGLKNVPFAGVQAVHDTIMAATKNQHRVNANPHSRAFHFMDAVAKKYGEIYSDRYKLVEVYGLAGSGYIKKHDIFKSVRNTVSKDDLIIECFQSIKIPTSFNIRFTANAPWIDMSVNFTTLTNNAIEKQRANGQLIELDVYRDQGDTSTTIIGDHGFYSPTIYKAFKDRFKKDE